MIRIDRLAPDDGSRLRAIRLRALADAPYAFSTAYEDAAAWPEARWTAQLVDLPTFVAVRDSVDVGMVRGAVDKMSDDVAWLLSMWVAPEARRAGVGSALVDAVIEWARAIGARRLRLDVVNDNEAAIALYEAKGFEQTGESGTFPPPRAHVREHRRERRIDARRT